MNFTDHLAPFAVKHGQANGVLPSLIIAQGILESASGTSELAVNANNLFGIKAGSGWSGEVYTKRTAEHKDKEIEYIHADFRRYPSDEGCVIDLVHKYTHGTGWEDHNRYAAVLGQTDYRKTTQALKEAGYATDPNYPTKLNKLIEQYDLTQYDGGDSMVKVALDGGHGFNTPGKRTPDDEREWSFNDKVLRACEAKLNSYQNVQILRLDDSTGKTDVPLKTRTDKANKWGADALVSIHHNANTAKWGSWGGTETLVQEKTASKASLDIANAIHPRIVKAMGLRDRGIKRQNLHMTRESKMPAILTEGGFMDSTTDIHALRDDNKLRAQGIAIAEGLAEYFKLKPKLVAHADPVPSGKEKDELMFSSPSLKTETELTLGSAARREIIVKAAVKAGAHASWLDKLENKTITDADVLGLAVKYTVVVNK